MLTKLIQEVEERIKKESQNKYLYALSDPEQFNFYEGKEASYLEILKLLTQLPETLPLSWIKCSECKTYIRKIEGWQEELIIHYLDSHQSKDFYKHETHIIVGEPIGTKIIPTGNRVTKLPAIKEEDEILE